MVATQDGQCRLPTRIDVVTACWDRGRAALVNDGAMLIYMTGCWQLKVNRERGVKNVDETQGVEGRVVCQRGV